MQRVILSFLLIFIVSSPAQAQSTQVRVLSFENDVHVDHRDGSDPLKIEHTNATVHVGDKIITGERATLRLLFENGREVVIGPQSDTEVKEDVAQGNPSEGLKLAFSRLFNLYEPQKAGVQRSGSDDPPVMIYPRYGKLYSAAPTFVWLHALPAGNAYRARIVEDPLCDPSFEPEAVIWERAGIRDSVLVYPPDAPALLSGGSYKIEMGRESKTEFEDAGCFMIATAVEKAEADEVRNQIRAAYPAADAQHITADLVFASWLIESGFYTDALVLLNQIEVNQPASPLLRQLKAYIYAQVGPLFLIPESP